MQLAPEDIGKRFIVTGNSVISHWFSIGDEVEMVEFDPDSYGAVAHGYRVVDEHGDLGMHQYVCTHDLERA